MLLAKRLFGVVLCNTGGICVVCIITHYLKASARAYTINTHNAKQYELPNNCLSMTAFIPPKIMSNDYPYTVTTRQGLAHISSVNRLFIAM